MQIRHANQNRDRNSQHRNSSWLVLVSISNFLLNPIINFSINIPVMNEVWRERREIELMTKQQMHDIGLDPVSIRQECKKSFFDIPTERRKSVKMFAQASGNKAF